MLASHVTLGFSSFNLFALISHGDKLVFVFFFFWKKKKSMTDKIWQVFKERSYLETISRQGKWEGGSKVSWLSVVETCSCHKPPSMPSQLWGRHQCRTAVAGGSWDPHLWKVGGPRDCRKAHCCQNKHPLQYLLNPRQACGAKLEALSCLNWSLLEKEIYIRNPLTVVFALPWCLENSPQHHQGVLAFRRNICSCSSSNWLLSMI